MVTTSAPAVFHSAATCAVAAGRVSVSGGQYHAPVAEQAGVRGADPGLLGAGQRMARHEIRKAVCQGAPGRGDDRALHAAHVGHNRVRRQSRRHESQDFSTVTHRHRDHYQPRIAHGVGGVDGSTIDDTKLDGQLEVADAAAKADDFAYRIDLLQGPGQRAADKADTDNGETINHRLRTED